MYINPFWFAIIVLFAAIGFIFSFRYLFNWKDETQRQLDKYRSFYEGSPKGMRRKLDETESFYHN